MMLRFVILTACVALCVNASCYSGPTSLDEETGIAYCQVTDTELLELDEVNVTSTCYKCECSTSGFECCGIGINAAAIEVPEGYLLVSDPPCDYHFQPINTIGR